MSPEPQYSSPCPLAVRYHILFSAAQTQCVSENVKRVQRVIRLMIGSECEVSSWSGFYEHSVAVTLSNLDHDKGSLV